MFTRKLTLQTKLFMLFIVFPLYLLCGNIIVSAFLKFLVLSFHLNLSVVDANAYLNLIIDLMYLIICCLVFKTELKEQIDDLLNFKIKRLLNELIVGTLLLFVFGIIGGIITSLLGGTNSSENQNLINEMFKTHYIIIFVTAVFFAPIVEEILFRGTIFAWINEYNLTIALIISSFLFGFIHVMNAVFSGNASEFIQIFPYMFKGFVLAYLYKKNNNIMIPILTHVLNNLIGLLLLL